jgi:hypothetical protein
MCHRLRQQIAVAKLITDDVFEVVEVFQAADSSKTPNATSQLTKRSA